MSLKPFTGHDGLIIGYTTRYHLLLDLDRRRPDDAERIARDVMKRWPKVGDALLVQSSPRMMIKYLENADPERPYWVEFGPNYHLVFDNVIGYNLICRICKELVKKGVLEQGYDSIRHWRGDLTLRVSPCPMLKYTKPIPTPLITLRNRYTKKRDGMIQQYLDILSFARSLFLGRQMVPEVSPDKAAEKALDEQDA